MPDLSAAPVVYKIPGMEQVPVQKDLVYKTVEGRPLLLDVYHPLDDDSTPRPAVIFVHGEAPPQAMAHAKDWGQYVSWGQLVAASGLVGITFNHRSVEGLTKLTDVAGDIDDLVAYLRLHADRLHIDPNRLCFWVCSAGGPVGLTAALRSTTGAVRCIVSYYAFMDLQHLDQFLGEAISPVVTPDLRRSFSPVTYLQSDRPIPPVFVMRAGQDQVPGLNESIDRFVAEGLSRNHPLTLVNAPEAPHAFDIRSDAGWARAIIRQTLAFMVHHLDGAGTPE
ncbi:MAG: alpha/beta hydrolase family protein [Mycobacterium leprae]